MMSCDFLLYQVMLASARSLKNPKSTPASSSLERSGFNTGAARNSWRVTKPPIPAWVGVLPVPWEMPPMRPGLNVVEVRYGCGSVPASPYATPGLPYDSPPPPPPRLLIPPAGLAVRQPRTLADRLRELPRQAPLREPAAQVGAPERRGAVVADGRGQVQLALDVEGALPEPRRVVDHLLLVDRQILLDRVRELVRPQPDQVAAHRSELALVAGVQVLADRHGAAQVRADRIGRRGRDVMVDQVVDDLALDHPPRDAGGRRAGGTPLQPLVGRVVRTQGVVDLQPGRRQVLGV